MADTLEKAIHDRWAAKPGLEALLPAASVVTGIVRDKDLPYATIRLKRGDTFHRGSQSQVDRVTLEIVIYHSDYDAGRVIQEKLRDSALHDGFDREQFDIDSNGKRALSIMNAGFDTSQDAKGTWQLMAAFTVKVSRPV